ncbi:MAG: hypothetical protein PHC31_04300 [Clostridia bacterium]|jgi:hypothetical protein|nr:hypothetical protein [Clostridia bacterium]MDD3971120.1 hypothetical protein [Clostridia bacterium]
MSVFERFMMGLIFAAALPIALFNVGWKFCEYFYNGDYLVICALSGLILGIIADILFLRKILLNAYSAGTVLPIFIYAFYLICFLLCFRKFPIFILIPGLFAGIYEGRKLFHFKANSYESGYRIERVSQLTSAGMAISCIISAFFVYLEFDESIDFIRRLFNTPDLIIEQWIVLISIILASTVLIFIQYWITRKAALLAYGKEERK